MASPRSIGVDQALDSPPNAFRITLLPFSWYHEQGQYQKQGLRRVSVLSL